jgi:hypothetical protein
MIGVASVLDATAGFTARGATALRQRAESLSVAATQPSHSLRRRILPRLTAFHPLSHRAIIAILVAAFGTAVVTAGILRPAPPFSLGRSVARTQITPLKPPTAATAPTERPANASIVQPAHLATAGTPSKTAQGGSTGGAAFQVVALKAAIPERRPSILASPKAARPADTKAIQRVLNRYRDAFSVLNVAWVKAVWPAADIKTLSASFNRISQQNFEFDTCRILVIETRAEATCRGTAEFTNAGSRRPRNESRRWEFALRKVSRDWLIESVQSH